MINVDDILKKANDYYSRAAALEKFAFIKKLPNGKYRVLSEKGKNLGTCDSREKAKQRLKEVEYFKHKDESSANDSSIDLSKTDDFSFSAIMRRMREKASPKQVREFLKLFNVNFEKAVKKKLQEPEKVSLQNSLVQFGKNHKLILDNDLVKNAAITELGDAALVGRYLADMIRFILVRISPEKRQSAIEKVKNKLYYLNETDISNKNLPSSSAMGQSITLVKNVLFNHDPRYIRNVINNLVRSL
jgi:hypothetical protein